MCHTLMFVGATTRRHDTCPNTELENDLYLAVLGFLIAPITIKYKPRLKFYCSIFRKTGETGGQVHQDLVLGECFLLTENAADTFSVNLILKGPKRVFCLEYGSLK